MGVFEPMVGRWWVAGDPDWAVPGSIALAPGGFGSWKLTTDGSLAHRGEPGFKVWKTIHGTTPSGEVTVRRACINHETSRREALISQTWQGQQLILGGHVNEGDTFEEVSFQLSHLLSWLGPSQLNMHTSRRFRVIEGDCGPTVEAQLDDDVSARLGATTTSHEGHHASAWAARGVYALSSPEGLTIDAADYIAHGLRDLHSTVMSRLVGGTGMTLIRAVNSRDMPLRLVDPDDPQESGHQHSEEYVDPLFDTSEIQFEPFIRAWMSIRASAGMAVAAAAATHEGHLVESRLVDICNGLEALAAFSLGRPPLGEGEKRVLALLRVNAFESKIRRKVKSGLMMQRWPLEDKLVSLVRTIGPESAAWLLGPSLPTWARLLARLRNSLAHGSTLPNGLSHDGPFLVVAMRSAQAVLRLALLSQAGYTNPCSRTPGELLWANGARTAGHPESAFFRDLEGIASYADHWQAWHDRLQQPD